MKNLKDLIAENMHRFGTKNLNEARNEINEVELHKVQNDWLRVTSEIESLVDAYFNDRNLKSGPTADMVQHLKKIEYKAIEKRELEKKFNDIAANGIRDLNLSLNPWSAR